MRPSTMVIFVQFCSKFTTGHHGHLGLDFDNRIFSFAVRHRDRPVRGRVPGSARPDVGKVRRVPHLPELCPNVRKKCSEIDRKRFRLRR